MANDKFSTSIRETFNTKYLKVFFLDDSEAQKTLDIIRAVNEEYFSSWRYIDNIS